MVTRRIDAKASSAFVRLTRDMRRAEDPEEREQIWQRYEAENPWLMSAIDLDRLCRNQRRLLLECANMREDGVERFMRIVFDSLMVAYIPPRTLQLRDELRRIWDPRVGASEKQRILNRWLYRDPNCALRVDWQRKEILPNPISLLGALTLGCLEFGSLMKVCGNPNCQAPYFIGRRVDQKFCERGDCTAYAQSVRARAWWSRSGPQWRAERKRVTSRGHAASQTSKRKRGKHGKSR
jgi:hypothetical protein